MTTYSATRDSEQLRYLEVDIAGFINRYQSRPPGTKRRTLFLFPGGMGNRSTRKQSRTTSRSSLSARCKASRAAS